MRSSGEYHGSGLYPRTEDKENRGVCVRDRRGVGERKDI